MQTRYPPWRGLLAVSAAIALIVLVIIIVTPGDESPPPPTHTLGGPKTTSLGPTQITTVPLTATGQKILKAQAAAGAIRDPGVESHLNAPAPSATATAQAKVHQPAGQPEVPAHVPLASAYQPGCKTAFVRNYSSRHGAPIDLGFIHWTGSPITPGTSGGLAIVRWFDTTASQASSDYVTDQAGNCWYTVPETFKAWTQAAANPWSLSVEIINPGVLPLFRTAAARNIVLKLMIGWHHRWKIPYQIGAVNSSCVPIRSGFLAHRDGGACAGGHPDVGIPSVVPELVRQAAALDGSGGRAADLRARNKKVHHDLRSHRCSLTHPRAPICVTLVKRHAALHAAAKKEHVRF